MMKPKRGLRDEQMLDGDRGPVPPCGPVHDQGLAIGCEARSGLGEIKAGEILTLGRECAN